MIKLYIVVFALKAGTVVESASSSAELIGIDLQREREREKNILIIEINKDKYFRKKEIVKNQEKCLSWLNILIKSNFILIDSH